MREFYSDSGIAAKDLGLSAAFFDDGRPFELWEENALPFRVFADNSTQWIMGSGGAVGLNYLVIFHELDRMNLEKEEYDRVMNSIRIIESEALNKIYERSK